MASLSRAEIARVAIALADDEGLEAVSMRKIAARMGVGTMSLYHYVSTKRDLYTVVSDAIMSEALIPDDEVPAGWREGLAEIGRRSWLLFTRHPWVLASWHQADQADPGESFVRHVEQTLAVVAELDFLPIAERQHLTGLVDEWVIGYFMRNATVADLGDDRTGWHEHLADRAQSGDFPHLAAALDAGLMHDPGGDFEDGLRIVLDGIEAHVERRRAGATA